MKKSVISLFVALVATMGAYAQQIAVVSEDGATTTIYKTLPEAVEGATDGSTLYLSGGVFKLGADISKRLNIVGVGYYMGADNAEGVTQIEGVLNFVPGSSRSTLMGCKVPECWILPQKDADPIEDIVIKCCWVTGRIYINNPNVSSGATTEFNDKCTGMVINQCFCDNIYLTNSNTKVTNSVFKLIGHGNTAEITNNIIITGSSVFKGSWSENYYRNCTIANNIIYDNTNYGSSTEFLLNNQIENNLNNKDLGDDAAEMTDPLADVFKDYQGVTPASDFHFTDAYKAYEGKVGIYSGFGFNDSKLPPVPYIASKNIPLETDANGKLLIRVRVKASSE